MFLTLVSWVTSGDSPLGKTGSKSEWRRGSVSSSPSIYQLRVKQGCCFFFVFFLLLLAGRYPGFLIRDSVWEPGSPRLLALHHLCCQQKDHVVMSGEKTWLLFFYQKKLQPDISGTLIYKLLRLLQISQYYHKKTNTICAHCWRRNPNPFIPTVHSEFFC